MNLETQFKIINDYNLQRYVRQNSYWYKTLNRNPEVFNTLQEEMKNKYKMNTEDKIEGFSEKIKTVQMFMNILR